MHKPSSFSTVDSQLFAPYSQQAARATSTDQQLAHRHCLHIYNSISSNLQPHSYQRYRSQSNSLDLHVSAGDRRAPLTEKVTVYGIDRPYRRVVLQ